VKPIRNTSSGDHVFGCPVPSANNRGLEHFCSWSSVVWVMIREVRCDVMGLAFKEDPMAKPYSNDLRERVLDRVDEGHKPVEVARLFSVSERTIWDWLALRKQTGTVDPRQQKFGPDPLLKEDRERILQSVLEQPGLTLAQRQTQLNLSGCPTTLWKALKSWGITFKKSHASGGTTPSRRSATTPLVGDSGPVQVAASAGFP